MAEFGRTTGMVNSFTKRVKSIHGSSFNFGRIRGHRQAFLAAREPSQTETTKEQWGGTLGGPIVHRPRHFRQSRTRSSSTKGGRRCQHRPDRELRYQQDTDVWTARTRLTTS